MMQWFQNLKIGAKIISIFVLMEIFMGVVRFTGYYFTRKLSADLDDIYINYLLPVQWLNDARNQSRAGEAAVMALLISLSAGWAISRMIARRLQTITNDSSFFARCC